MEFLRARAAALLLIIFAFSSGLVVASSDGNSRRNDKVPAESRWSSTYTGQPIPLSAQAANQTGFAPSGSVGMEGITLNFPGHGGRSRGHSFAYQPQSQASFQGHYGTSTTPRGVDAVCSNGLRLAFDCALKRIVAFGVRDYLVDKYKLPMVPLDVCQGDILMDVEQCIPGDFVNTFPSDTLLEVVRQKRLTVGTMDLSVFPQLASDQAYTIGFYPELLQAIVHELTVIVLQNPGLRREVVGDRQLSISILEKPFSKRVKDVKAAVARKWRHGDACESRSGIAVSGLQQLPISTGGDPSSDDSLPGEKGQPGSWQDELLCGESSAGGSPCFLHGCLSPWEAIPKDILIGVTHVKFSTPMNLIAAVHRGEVHMTDVGTLASAYLPERYNFLPLREVLEPSCTIGAWKSFFLLRDPASKRRLERRVDVAELKRKLPTRQAASGMQANFGRSRFTATDSGKTVADEHSAQKHCRGCGAEDIDCEGRLPAQSRYLGGLESAESWEDRVIQTRKVFYRLYGVQAAGSSTSEVRVSEPASILTAGTSGGFSAGRSAETETAYEEKTLVKLHHVDHFTFSYLFPEDFRICSVRKLTDLTSLLSDGEPIGAFGYGLAGRGGRRRIFSSSKRPCPPQHMSGHIPGLEWRRHRSLPLTYPTSRRRGAGDVSKSRRSLRQDVGGFPQVMEFPGPLVPLAAFFAKSRDPACRGYRKRARTALTQKPSAQSSVAEPKTLSSAVVIVALVINLVFS